MEEAKCYHLLMRIAGTLMIKSLSQINASVNHWPSRMLPPRMMEGSQCLPGCCWGNTSLSYPNEVGLGLLTFDIPVSSHQSLTCLGFPARFHLAQCSLSAPELQEPRVASTVLKKLGALSPEMWGEQGLRRHPRWVMVASSFPSRREKSRLG